MSWSKPSELWLLTWRPTSKDADWSFHDLVPMAALKLETWASNPVAMLLLLLSVWVCMWGDSCWRDSAVSGGGSSTCHLLTPSDAPLLLRLRSSPLLLSGKWHQVAAVWCVALFTWLLWSCNKLGGRSDGQSRRSGRAVGGHPISWFNVCLNLNGLHETSRNRTEGRTVMETLSESRRWAEMLRWPFDPSAHRQDCDWIKVTFAVNVRDKQRSVCFCECVLVYLSSI